MSSFAKSPTPVIAGRWVLAILSMLMGFASISTDFYLPAMPAMSRSLHAAPGMIELTISSYLIGFSIGQLFWGPIGDRYGRRTIVAIGLVLFVIGSAGCALSGSALAMIGWRMVQAVGACAGVVLARAMVRDLYQGPRAAQMLSTLMTVMAIAPLVGPSLGGQIVALSGWHMIFWMLVAIGLVTLALLYTIPETLPVTRRNPEPIYRAMLRYGELLRRPRLLGYAGVGGFFYAASYAYIAGSPFTYISYYHVPEQLFGLLFALNISGIMVSNVINARLVMRYGYDRILAFGTVMATLFAVIIGIVCLTGMGGFWGLVVSLFLFVATTGFIVANAITGALADYPERAGAVSALIGAFQYGSGIAGSALVGLLADGTPWPMGWVMALAGIGSLISLRLVFTAQSKKSVLRSGSAPLQSPAP
ncbi:MAG: multidrug effflux MFS transporter [Rhizomicrobium sp.]